MDHAGVEGHRPHDHLYASHVVRRPSVSRAHALNGPEAEFEVRGQIASVTNKR